MDDTLAELNPAAIQRQIQALTAELLTLTTSKAAARTAGSPPSAAPPITAPGRSGDGFMSTRRRQERVDTAVRCHTG